jgi:hypothetical protein
VRAATGTPVLEEEKAAKETIYICDYKGIILDKYGLLYSLSVGGI